MNQLKKHKGRMMHVPVKPDLKNNDGHVIACIPYYQCQKYIRRAVESLLAQTYRNLTVVVINDADFTAPPWPALADIHDPRLVRFDLMENKGPYFATQVVLNAANAAYLLIQDADDWSHPERIACLLNALERDKADFAVSAQPQFYEDQNGKNRLAGIRWLKKTGSNMYTGLNAEADRFQLDTKLTAQYRYRSPHHGLFRIETLRGIGGYYGGFRFNYDVLVTNLILMVGKVTHVPQPLYHRLLRPASLTQCPETGIRSRQRTQIGAKTSELYQILFRGYQAFLQAQITGLEMRSLIKKICERYITPEDEKNLITEAQRLQKHFKYQRCAC